MTRKDFSDFNCEIQAYHFDGDIGILTRKIPKKILLVANAIQEIAIRNNEFYKYSLGHSLSWLNEEASCLESLTHVSDEKRRSSLDYSKKWIHNAIFNFFQSYYHFEGTRFE